MLTDRRSTGRWRLPVAALAGTAMTLTMATTAANASAAPTSTTGPAATCRYQVNHVGGIYVYRWPNVGEVLASFAHGAIINATCENVTGEGYIDCPSAGSLWKGVSISGGRFGYIKTKCLIRR